MLSPHFLTRFFPHFVGAALLLATIIPTSAAPDAATATVPDAATATVPDAATATVPDAPIATGPDPKPGALKVVAYVPNWVDLRVFADTIDFDKITHINLAFENPTDDDGDLSFDESDAILIEKAHARGVEVSVSLGGGAAATDPTLLARYALLLGPIKRADFVAKIAAYVLEHHFDGLDVDLEGPAIDDDYGAFIDELATAFHAQNKHLTAALSRGYGGDGVPDSVFKRLDWVNIMAYDATGPWNAQAPGQHSSLDFALSNVDYWLGRGLPRAKAILGVPFYGYGFGPASSPREYPYSKILELYPGAEQADEAGETIWYNGLATIKAKAQYARDKGLGGMMIWSLDSDAKGDLSLLSALAATLKG